MKKTAQVMDLLISHSQIQFRSRPFDEASSQWGEVNLEQGAIIHSDYVVFDPLPEDAFGANMHLKLEDSFRLDPSTQHPAPSAASSCRFMSQIPVMWKLHPLLKTSRSSLI
ncbi:competence protein ComJ [Pseudomonas sp. EL_65y_Pfl2_R96]|uniref:competence protein ComJ n=1 Tax=Pseudomonas sp. EL_65y_Pfl2_R96 TaxID=3088699 RepID=UPI0030DBB57E